MGQLVVQGDRGEGRGARGVLTFGDPPKSGGVTSRGPVEIFQHRDHEAAN